MVLEEYSVEEQLLRFDESVFDDMLIHRPTEEHEVCPCCAAGHVHHEDHEHCATGSSMNTRRPARCGPRASPGS
jgi:hypothetical protein